MRTAESVLLTCWPPAPEDRYVSIRMSLSWTSISMVSGAVRSTANRVRTIVEEAPRGRILDASGNVLVDNRVENDITVDRTNPSGARPGQQITYKADGTLGARNADPGGDRQAAHPEDAGHARGLIGVPDTDPPRTPGPRLAR